MEYIKRYIFNGWENAYAGIHVFTLFLFFFTLFILASCIDEHMEDDKNSLYGERVSISLSASLKGLNLRAYDEGVTGSEKDRIIKEVRVLIFDTSGDLAYQRYIADNEALPDDTFGITLRKGIYDFVFIANEGSDPALVTTLNGLDENNTLSDVENLRFSCAAFNSQSHVPMSHIEKAVEILANDKYNINGTEYTGTWQVALKRLAIRLDIKIFTQSTAKRADFRGLEISNIPDKVPILETTSQGTPLYNGGSGNWETPARSYPVTSGDNGGFENAQGGYEWILSRIILPSSVFTPDNQSNAIKLKVLYEDREDETAVLQATGSTSYLAPRNNYYTIEGTLQMDALEIYMGVEDWDEKLFDASLLEKTLNVSRIEASINERNMARIYFWSDQKEVFIEDLTSDNENVDHIFYDLIGTNPENFHYQYNNTTGEGSGYFDIMTDRDKGLISTGSNYEHKILLNAGGLKREIKVDVAIPSTTFAAYDYVGAFWRNNQTGERVIAMANTNPNPTTASWKAEVTAGNFIILAPGKSLDEKIWTNDEPGNAENYQVEGTATTVTGTGKIYFRIGLTSTNPNPAQPRYGKVTVTKGNNTTYDIYIRQGEEADYLMRDGDPIPSGVIPVRDKTARYSPYNLTSQEYLNGTKNGGADISGHSQIGGNDVKTDAARTNAAFVEYPSQAGAFFQFASTSVPRYAWHPTLHPTSVTGWDGNGFATTYWNTLATQHETCPPGYRRPQDGSIKDENVSGSVEDSEQRQSLWLNPVEGSQTDNFTNNLWGYMADGFFDRHPIVASVNNQSNTAVCITGNNAAYIGRLFYNPNNNASLFFPAAGIRDYTSGVIASGRSGLYWTASAPNSNYGWRLGFTNSSANQGSTSTRSDSNSIRCVVDEPFAELIWTNKDRVLADEDALLNGTTGAAQMNWAQAMGINTTYNSNLFYNSGFSTNEMSNYGYSNNSQVAASPKTGCAAYWQGDENDPVTGIGKWYLPVPEEFKDLHDTGKFLSGTPQNPYYGYWTSGEDDSNYGCLLTCSDQNVGTPAYQSKTGTLRENHTRCVRNPTAEELAWRLANK